jgi:hypothetical protein
MQRGRARGRYLMATAGQLGWLRTRMQQADPPALVVARLT